MKKLTILVPAFNEEGCIFPFYEAVEPFLDKEKVESRYLFIDDGSKDNTLNELKELRKKDKRVHYISLSRNSGKEAALEAGLKASLDQDLVIMMDADLQHPPYLIKDMLEKNEEGYKIVYTRQRNRKGDSFLKKVTARMFYSVFNKYSDVPLEQSSKDYMLIDKDVVKAFLDMPDRYRFTRGIFSYVGFKKYCLEFDFVQREIGKTKWNLKKLYKYGINGLNQFSNVFLLVPKMVAWLSFLTSVASIFLFCFNVISLEAFLIMLIVPFFFMLTNIVLYWMMFVLYSTRREAMRRPIYFVGESSLDE